MLKCYCEVFKYILMFKECQKLSCFQKSVNEPCLMIHLARNYLVIFIFIRYDPQTDQWCDDVAPTSTCRTSVGVAVLDRYMYAVGGQDGVSCLNIVERYSGTKLCISLNRSFIPVMAIGNVIVQSRSFLNKF